MVKKILLWIFAIPVLGVQGIFLLSLMETHEVKVELPKPHYQPKPTDPAWLARAVQFHGHLGPWAITGIRFGVAGREAVGAQGYFDLHVRCQGPLERPPQACFLDGLQVGTGATLGKRNIHWEPGDELVVWVNNTRTGQTAEVRPTQEFWQFLNAAKTKSKPTGASGQDHPEDHHHEHLADQQKESLDSRAGPLSEPAGKRPSETGKAAAPGTQPESGQLDQSQEDPVEAAAREIARLPQEKILIIKLLSNP